VQQGLETLELPRGLARNWLAKKPHESVSTQQQRITVVRQFSKFLLTAGCPAYLPDVTVAARKSIFVPRMLTEEELRKFFRAVDTLEPTARSPLRRLIMPEVFRLLYGCGFRVREVLNLRIRDVDLNQGIITVRQGKFRKDRLVPPALSLVNRLRKYAGHFDSRPPDAQHLSGTQHYLISPPRSFPKSPHELRGLLVRSFPGELIDDAHRFFHSCDQFLNASLGRTAEPQSQYD
jgi:integrase/recombinase XerD